MSKPEANNAFDSLLERLCIEDLADHEWQDLATRVAQDDEALRKYIEAALWRHSLGYLVGKESRPQRNLFPPVETRPKKAADDSYEPNPPVNTVASDNLSSSPLASWRRWIGSWVVAACVAFVAGAGITAIAVRPPAERSRPETAQRPARGPTVAFVPQASFIQESQLGKVTGLSWEASADGLLRSLQVGQELRCGEVVQLTLGYMRVALHSGPELIIEGPAEFSIIGKDSVFVRVGRVAASDAAKNLMLHSPLLTAECNGAELMFAAEEDLSTKVFAYKGVVSLRSIAEGALGNGKLAVLHEGQGLLVQRETTTTELSKLALTAPVEVVRTWAEVEAKLTDAERLVLSDRPVAYWPLHHVRRNRRVLDLTQHGFDGQAIGNWPDEVNSNTKNERGAQFNGESYIEPDRKPRIDLRKGFTVESWAKVAGGPAFQSIFTSRWVLDAHTPHRQCLGFTLYAGDNDLWQLWTGNGRYGEYWNELHSTVAVVRHRWTHVVGTFEPNDTAESVPIGSLKGTARIFVDGKQVAEGEHEMSLMDFEWPARIGAAEFVPNSLTAWLFRGSLRDIAVYDYPLEGERIRAHFEAGKDAS